MSPWPGCYAGGEEIPCVSAWLGEASESRAVLRLNPGSPCEMLHHLAVRTSGARTRQIHVSELARQPRPRRLVQVLQGCAYLAWPSRTRTRAQTHTHHTHARIPHSPFTGPHSFIGPVARWPVQQRRPQQRARPADREQHQAGASRPLQHLRWPVRGLRRRLFIRLPSRQRHFRSLSQAAFAFASSPARFRFHKHSRLLSQAAQLAFTSSPLAFACTGDHGRSRKQS